MSKRLFLLDTNILSMARKEKKPPEIVEFFSQLSFGDVAIPTPVIFELERGAQNLVASDPALAMQYSMWLEALLQRDVYVLTTNAKVERLVAEMSHCGPLKNFWVNPRDAKKIRFGSDPKIAAISIVHQIPVATSDVYDFLLIHRHYPLPGLYDPMTRTWHVDPPMGWALEPANDGAETFEDGWVRSFQNLEDRFRS